MKELSELKGLLKKAEAIAAEHVKDKVLGLAPHTAPLRARVSAALELVEHLENWAKGAEAAETEKVNNGKG